MTIVLASVTNNAADVVTSKTGKPVTASGVYYL